MEKSQTKEDRSQEEEGEGEGEGGGKKGLANEVPSCTQVKAQHSPPLVTPGSIRVIGSLVAARVLANLSSRRL